MLLNEEQHWQFATEICLREEARRSARQVAAFKATAEPTVILQLRDRLADDISIK